jgi:cytochrome o ubiquinol oxidase subunit 2
MLEGKPMSTARRSLGRLTVLLPALLLGACHHGVLDPAGDVALQQRDIIYISAALMLLIIIPVMALTVIFAWRYRAKNTDATYDPDFDHSTALELVIWAAPLLIIICLGALTWWSTHLLDPFRPLNRISADKPIDPRVKPLRVQVISLDWKWLFIYPEQGVASINQLALPVDRPVSFELTSPNMMNTFYAPAMAGMIYTMPGMRSTLHAVINRPGHYRGMSGNYSGAGFSYMNFDLDGVDQRGFDAWIARAKAANAPLDVARYIELEKPSERVPTMLFSAVAPGLFDRVYNRCIKPGTPCMNQTMHDGQANMAQPGDPNIGSGMPTTRNAPPPHGEKPEGALFKEGDEKGVGPNITKPRGSDTPGTTAPASKKNRNMSFNQVPAALASPSAGAA